MNLLEMICKKLGVEVGEIFKMRPAGEDEQSFRLDSVYGLEVYNKTAEMWVSTGNHIYSDFITSRLKPKWKPSDGQFYYVPFINSIRDTEVWDSEEWGIDELYDEAMLKRGLVFKTKEEAIKTANKMLEAIKGDK